MFKAITDMFKEAQPVLDGILSNYKYWESQLQAEGQP